MDELDKSTEETDSALKSFSATTKKTGKIVAGVTLGLVAAGSALSAMIINTAMSRRELELYSKQAKLSVDDFNALAFATKQFGIEADQIANISKDISDKLGEFGREGTGPFEDFVTQMQLTKEEGQVLALQMQEMSSDQVIGLLVNRMEEAGLSGNEMTRVLESMGDDLSKLVPLFANNSRELDNLTGSFKGATKEMQITAEEAKDLEGAAKSWDLLTASLNAGATDIAAFVAPQFSAFFDGVTAAVPSATEAVKEFLRLLEHPDVKKGGNILSGQIIRDDSGKVTGSVADGDPKQSAAVKKEVSEAEILAEVRANNRALEKEASDKANADTIQRIEDRLKTETELLDERLISELEITAGNNELQLEIRQEHANAIVEIEREKDEEIFKSNEKQRRKDEKALNDEVRRQKKAASEKARIENDYLSVARSINTLLFEDKKEIGAGIIVADTAIGISRAFADLPYPAAIAASVSIAASGAVQLAALNSASRGGGASPSAPSAVALDTNEFQEDQSEILLSQTDTSGANQTITVKFEGSGDEITEALAKNMVVLRRNGTIDA